MNVLIVGAGLYGATMARLLADDGHRVRVIERRDHIAGNCYSYAQHGIEVHRYGPHIFHTSLRDVWTFANRYATFLTFHLAIKSRIGDRYYSLPINLNTMNQLWGVTTPAEARARLEDEKVPVDNPANLEDWARSQIGDQLYQMFIRPYTIKQWNKDPRDLPPFIIKRLPIRFSFDDNYFNDRWTAIPEEGYTAWIGAMLDGIPVDLNTDFFDRRADYEREFDRIFYTGPLDRFFDYAHGHLEYRSLRFETEVLEQPDFQGAAIVNYPGLDHDFTRIVEHRHFVRQETAKTVITTEYPDNWEPGKLRLYPVNTEENNRRAELYKRMLHGLKGQYVLGGRLADYKYYDMDKTIAAALETFGQIAGRPAVG